MFKIDNSLIPTINQSCYTRNNSPIFARQKISKFILPTPRTTYSKRHCTYSTIKLWNNYIPNAIKQTNRLNNFKTAFKNYLLNPL